MPQSRVSFLLGSIALVLALASFSPQAHADSFGSSYGDSSASLKLPSDTDPEKKDADLSVYKMKPSEPGFIEKYFRKFTGWSDRLTNGDNYSEKGPNGLPRRSAVTRIDREALNDTATK